VIWEPYALAIAFGLVISLGIYFIFVWPKDEPDNDET